MSQSTRSKLVDRVLEKFDNGIDDPYEASSQVIKNATEEEIESVAVWGLYQAYKERMRGFGQSTNNQETKKNEDPNQQNKSKFNSVENDKLSYPIPIDSSGEKKPLKDWTIEDVQRKKSYLKSLRNSLDTKIKYWEEIKQKMKEKDADRLSEINDEECVKKVIKINT